MLKVFLPPVFEIVWPHGRRWMRNYLITGYDSLTPRDWVLLTTQMGIQEPTLDDIDAYVIYTLARMGFSLSAIREFFARPEIRVKPDVDALYARSVAQQHSQGRAPLLGEGALFQLLRILRSYYDRPEGQALLRSTCENNQISVNTKRGTFGMNITAIIPRAASEAARTMMTMPEKSEIIRDCKKSARKEYVVEIATYRGGKCIITLSLDWMLRHDLLPSSLGFSSCIRKKRR
jgi:hypothetical protein